MSDHGDAKLQRCAHAMKQAFFDEFGHPDTLSEAELGECMASLISIHVGALIEAAARFSGAGMDIRQVCVDFIDRMIAANPDVIADMAGDRDIRSFLVGDRP